MAPPSLSGPRPPELEAGVSTGGEWGGPPRRGILGDPRTPPHARRQYRLRPHPRPARPRPGRRAAGPGPPPGRAPPVPAPLGRAAFRPAPAVAGGPGRPARPGPAADEDYVMS